MHAMFWLCIFLTHCLKILCFLACAKYMRRLALIQGSLQPSATFLHFHFLPCHQLPISCFPSSRIHRCPCARLLFFSPFHAPFPNTAQGSPFCHTHTFLSYFSCIDSHAAGQLLATSLTFAGLRPSPSQVPIVWRSFSFCVVGCAWIDT